MTAIVNPRLAGVPDGNRYAIIRGVSALATQSISNNSVTQVDFNSNSGAVFQDTENGAANLAGNYIQVPVWANFVYVAGHIEMPQQTTAAGTLRAHLWRDDDGGGFKATTEDLFYHCAIPYPSYSTTGGYYSLLATTGLWVPITGQGEKWALYVYQDTGASQILSIDKGTWLGVWFKS